MASRTLKIDSRTFIKDRTVKIIEKFLSYEQSKVYSSGVDGVDKLENLNKHKQGSDKVGLCKTCYRWLIKADNFITDFCAGVSYYLANEFEVLIEGTQKKLINTGIRVFDEKNQIKVLARGESKVRLTLENEGGFVVENDGKHLVCEPIDLKLQKGPDNKVDRSRSPVSNTSSNVIDGEELEVYDDIAEESDNDDCLRDTPDRELSPVRKRGRPRKSSPGVNDKQQLRVVLEKLDVKSGKAYEVDSASEGNSERESDEDGNEPRSSKNLTQSIGGRTRTRVIRKPTKYTTPLGESLASETHRSSSAKSSTRHTSKNAHSPSTPHRGLQLPTVTPKTAFMNSMGLKPAGQQSGTPKSQLILLTSPATLIEKDGQKQLILPPGSTPITQEVANQMTNPKSVAKPKKVKGPYPTMLIGPGFKGKPVIDKENSDTRDMMMDDEDADPDWDPQNDDDDNLVATATTKRKATDTLLKSALQSKIAKLTPETTPIGKRFSSSGKRFDLTKNRVGAVLNQLPKTPLVTIKPNTKNKQLWDDHDYLRQRETMKPETQTRSQTRKLSGLSAKIESLKNANEESNEVVQAHEPENEQMDDVDEGLNFQKTFMRQLTIPTVYNINQVNTEYLQMKQKEAPVKKPTPQEAVPVDLEEVPRIYQQIIFTSKGRPLRIQVRKKKAEIENQKKKDEEEEEDEDDDDDEDDDELEKTLDNVEGLDNIKLPYNLIPTDSGDIEMFDDTVEEQQPENEGMLGGHFVALNENGEEIKFQDENGEPIELFDEFGNMKELYTEDGNVLQFVDEAGDSVQAIEEEPGPDYSNFDPNLKVESFDDVNAFFGDYESYDATVLDIEEEEYVDVPIEDVGLSVTSKKQTLSNISSSANTVPCEICSNFFLNHKNLLAHVRSKHKKDKSFASFESRIREKLKVKCEICEDSMDTDIKLMEHMQHVHKVEAKHKCKTCGKGFMVKIRLDQHEKKVHHAIDQLCHLCPAVFKNARSLERHIEMHTSGQWDKLEEKKICPHCRKKFDKSTSLQAHIKSRHSDPGKSNQAPVCRCWTCQAEFVSAKELRKHMIAEHVLHGHKYHCTLCKKVFDSMDALTNHKSEVHSGGISLHCPFCGIGYMARHTLISHISNNHLNRETPYKCPFCPSKFIRAVFLQKHIGVVHDLVAEVEVRKGSCDDQNEEKSTSKKCIFENCDKTFIREKDVVEHILDSHKEEFPHECEICGQRFAKDKYVTSHAHAAHKTKAFIGAEAPTDVKEPVTKVTPISVTKPGHVIKPRIVTPKVTTPKLSKVNVVPTTVKSTESVTNVAVASIAPPSATANIVTQTIETPSAKRTIILDTSQFQTTPKVIARTQPQVIQQVQASPTLITSKTIQTRSPAKSYPTAVTRGTAATVLGPGKTTLYGNKIVTAKNQPPETYIQQIEIPSTTTTEVQPQYQIQTVPQTQYTDYVVTSRAPDQPQQNVDVEQIVYNLNVETNPRAWHYSRIEDHAATMTISQEQTSVMAGDAQSSINVVSAEDLWRIINENIDQ
ncbi:uncharacterized protein LOC126808624 isoform X2 [Patella vulgata]|uniref:uncharacterized protein LOC126808624 isoform X2 n=1 Tax=Patella vulgata TaxID=6465 RepID=UPI00217FEED9|nr:uncharacterized protein LOC126808624 isoform X2 [Patella vulgata]